MLLLTETLSKRHRSRGGDCRRYWQGSSSARVYGCCCGLASRRRPRVRSVRWERISSHQQSPPSLEACTFLLWGFFFSCERRSYTHHRWGNPKDHAMVDTVAFETRTRYVGPNQHIWYSRARMTTCNYAPGARFDLLLLMNDTAEAAAHGARGGSSFFSFQAKMNLFLDEGMYRRVGQQRLL